LHAGRKPREAVDPDAVTIKDVVNAFLWAKESLKEAGESSPRTFDEYNAMTDELIAHSGKSRLVSDLASEDFAALRKKLAKRWGPHRLKKAVKYIRSIFKHAHESELIDRPMRFGPEFKAPSKKTLRLHRAKQGAKLFTHEEVRKLLDAAGTPMKAMLLLGINCAFGNQDCGTLPLSALDLEVGWVNYARPKTGIDRRCPLWPETVKALREALAKRKEPKDKALADDPGE
jgi:integrase